MTMRRESDVLAPDGAGRWPDSAGASSDPARPGAAPCAAEVRDLRVRRGGSFVLQVPRLEVAAGETLAVLGLNGAGKSTLLEVLALLRPPDAGEVRILGERTRCRGGRQALRRRLGLALQDPFLLLGSILDNVALPLRLRGVSPVEARRRAQAWLERLGVGHLAGRASHAASGGEARRVSLARALVTEPDLLLLDEPFSALDPPTHDALLRDFQRALPPGAGVVLVTHDRSEALDLAQQVAVLQAGRLLQWGPARDLFRAPASEEVAALVGLDTILRGTVRSSGQGLIAIEVAPGVLVEAAGDAAPGSRVTLCIHPEEVTLERPGPGTRSTARNLFPALIRSLAPHGPGRRVTLDCPFPLVALVTLRSVEELQLGPGERISASFKASAVHLFPARADRPL
jgi:tungstate transport system ATP-binding protein